MCVGAGALHVKERNIEGKKSPMEKRRFLCPHGVRLNKFILWGHKKSYLSRAAFEP